MMENGILIQQEKKDQNRAKKIALLVHSILILGLVVPFLNSQLKEDKPVYEQIVVIDFSDKNDKLKSAAAKSSTRKASPTATKAVEKPTPKPPVVKPTTPKPTPKPPVVKPTPPVAKHKPVITTPKPAPPIKTAPTKKNIPVEKPKVEVVKTPPTPPTPPKESTSVFSKIFSKDKEEEKVEEVVTTEAETTKTDKASGKASETGEGDAGSSKTGNAKTDGKADKGDSGDDFSGDGLFTRKVVYRADVKKLTQEEGKIVINLCVSQQGSVTFTEYNAEESTITDIDLVVKAKKAAAKYKFEKDYSAPTKQCGQLTFSFKF